RAAVELDQVEVVGAESFQAALDAREDGGRPPPRAGAAPAVGVATLGEQVHVITSAPKRPADQLLARVVALRRVDHVEAGVDGAAEQSRDGTRAHALIADLRSAEPQRTDNHVGLAELAPFHGDYFTAVQSLI